MIQRIESYRHKNFCFRWRLIAEHTWMACMYYKGKRTRAEITWSYGVVELYYKGHTVMLTHARKSFDQSRDFIETMAVCLHGDK